MYDIQISRFSDISGLLQGNDLLNYGPIQVLLNYSHWSAESGRSVVVLVSYEQCETNHCWLMISSWIILPSIVGIS